MHVRLRRLPAKVGGAFRADSVRVEVGAAERVPLFLGLPFNAAPNLDRVILIQARAHRWSPWVTCDQLLVHAAEVRVPMLVRHAKAAVHNGNRASDRPTAVAPAALL